MAPCAVARRTSDALVDGLVTHMEREDVDIELAKRQHSGYCAALRQAGYEVVEVESAPDQPHAVFVEDTAVVVDATAVITRPGEPERRAETAGTENVLAGLGMSIARIDAPGTLDGGDVLQVGSTVYAGRGGRTNADGIRQLRALLEPLGRTVVAVRLRDVLHLKSAVTALPDHSFLARQRLFETGALPVTREMPEQEGSHVVPLADGSVLVSASAPGSAEVIEDLGYHTRVVDISEFEKREGCVTCLSILVDAPS